MARFALLGLVIVVIVAGTFAYRARGGRADPTGRAQTGYQAVPVGRGEFLVRPTTVVAGTGEMAMVNYLRQAIVSEMAYSADQGAYTTDITKLRIDRPANVQVIVPKVGDMGMRMTAINEQLGRQCDIFAGDSAKWAFGYAWDSRVPRCGKIR